MDIRTAVLLGKIIAPGTRHAGVIDRPGEYAAAGVPFFLRVDLRHRAPAMALFKLVEGEHELLAAAVAGQTFVMADPFEFSLDPVELLEDHVEGGG